MGRTDHCSRFDDSCHAGVGNFQTLDIPEMAAIDFIEEMYFFFMISCCQDIGMLLKTGKWGVMTGSGAGCSI